MRFDAIKFYINHSRTDLKNISISTKVELERNENSVSICFAAIFDWLFAF
jgi:hypothetical protein